MKVVSYKLRVESCELKVELARRLMPVLVLLMILLCNISSAQTTTDSSALFKNFFQPTSSLNKKRLKLALGTEAVMYTGSMSGLYVLWYKDYPQSNFHFFNDIPDWLQMDKAGHFTTSYYIGKLGIDVMNWTGLDRKAAIWIGASVGLAFQTTIEIFDGFSSQWGFSVGDMTANTLGSVLLVSQAFAWGEQRIQPKFSVQTSKYAQYRPAVLGSDIQERIFKDYNGQTYWLSGNISSFMNKKARFPKWLNIAVGYGADGMTGGTTNHTQNEAGQVIPSFTRQRQFYLALDADLSRIPTKNRFLKAVFTTIGFLKIPAPAIEFNSKSGTLQFYPFYF